LNSLAPPSYLLIMANKLDCSFMREFLLGRMSLQAPHIQFTDDFAAGVEQITQSPPQMLIVDPKCNPQAVCGTVELAKNHELTQFVILDDSIREGVIVEILPYRISYLTRQMSSYELVACLNEIATKKTRVFDPAIRDRLRMRNHDWQLVGRDSEPTLALLTAKERGVLKLIAMGLSIAECGEQLGVTASTVDDHKTNIMRKLDLHKITHLARFAIRHGLVQV
jgi:DNA-binding NarL/FixJ family response regulator